uniref:CYP720B11 n=1 Tax=Pinus contorta TaxID=3339 RepID=A0A076U7E6_PINCO|nr:CYP720B11 [Pinus contorta]
MELGIMAETSVTYSWLVGFVCFVLAMILLQLYRIVDSRGYNLPPGSRGWPLIGESLGFMRAINSGSQPRRFIQDRELRYGEIFRSNLFGRSRMIVSVDPEFNKHILQNEGRLFQSNYPRPFRNLIGKFGLVAVHGDLQKKLHGTAVNFLGFEKLRVHFMEDIQNLMQTTFAQWQAKRDIHLHEECHQLVLNLMAKQLLDLSPSKETEEMGKAFAVFSKAFLAVPIRIPGTSYARGIKGRAFLIKKIKEGIKHRRQHPDEAVHNDFLGELLKEDLHSEEVIADLVLFLLFAGHETSASAMVFSIKFLTDCPRALHELKEEHGALLKRNGSPRNQKLTWDDYRSMKFTECVIYKTLRLANVASAIFREAKEDIKIKGGFVIPRGWTVMVLLNSMHLDEKYHSSALTFDPWRWQRQLENNELSKNPSFIPFGGGARLCPGMHLAKLELALFLHNFVTKFRWEAVEDDKISYFPVSHLTKGFPIRLHHLQERMDD